MNADANCWFGVVVNEGCLKYLFSQIACVHLVTTEL